MMRTSSRRVVAALLAAAMFAAGAASANPPDPVEVTSVLNTYYPGDDSHPAGLLELRVAQSQAITYRNLDFAPHNITSDANNGGIPYFSSETTSVFTPNQPVEVTGSDTLAPGSYGFYCTVHPFMRGTLVVEG